MFFEDDDVVVDVDDIIFKIRGRFLSDFSQDSFVNFFFFNSFSYGDLGLFLSLMQYVFIVLLLLKLKCGNFYNLQLLKINVDLM